MTVLLEARALACGYNRQPVVRDLDLEVGEGEVVALLGANGAGKSTTLSTLTGYLDLLGGEVVIAGRLATSTPHARARDGLAYVPEGRSVFMGLSVRENLKLARGDMKLALALFPELERRLGQKAGSLSGGEQQMLALGRALSRRPKLLLADELSLGLAPLLVSRLLQAVRRSAEEDGLGVLLVEQHVRQALASADRAYVMRRGSIVLSGPVDEVGPSLETAYLAASG